jgi:endonuclease/exonuclease/phosphatase family metal-dependent hydrolase
MKIVTYNMRAGGSPARWQTLLHVCKPDFALVQETREPREFPPDLLHDEVLDRAGWTSAAHGKWSSALWARDGIRNALNLSGASWWTIGDVISSSLGELLLCCVHLAPLDGSYEASARAAIEAASQAAEGRPMIVGGAWNLTVSERASSDSRVTPKRDRELLRHLRDSHGLASAWSIAHPEQDLPHTLRWSSNKEIPYHCDGFFVPVSWASRVRSVEVLTSASWTALSDHNPVVLDLDTSPLPL